MIGEISPNATKFDIDQRIKKSRWYSRVGAAAMVGCGIFSGYMDATRQAHTASGVVLAAGILVGASIFGERTIARYTCDQLADKYAVSRGLRLFDGLYTYSDPEVRDGELREKITRNTNFGTSAFPDTAGTLFSLSHVPGWSAIALAVEHGVPDSSRGQVIAIGTVFSVIGLAGQAMFEHSSSEQQRNFNQLIDNISNYGNQLDTE